MDTVTDALLQARARVVHDLAACGLDTAACVSVVDEAVSSRRWWADEWPEGAQFLTCLVAQDVQEALLDEDGVDAGHGEDGVGVLDRSVAALPGRPHRR